MKSKTALRTAFITSNVGLLALLIIGLKTVSKYSGSLRDWHYSLALAGSILIILIMLVSLLFAFRLAKSSLN